MNTAEKIPIYSVEEYFALERESDIRHEFLDGEIVAMGGASRLHNQLVFRLGTLIEPRLDNTPCRIGGTDMKVFIAAANRAYYPDLVVSCSDPSEEPDEYTETQPRLIIEVLSPSTAKLDKTEKRRNYQRLQSLQEYVLVAQDEHCVEVYRRESESWVHTIYCAGDSVELASIAVSLPVSAIYRGLLASD